MYTTKYIWVIAVAASLQLNMDTSKSTYDTWYEINGIRYQ